MTTYAVGKGEIRYSHTIGQTSDSGPGFAHPVGLIRMDEDLLYVVSRSHEDHLNGKRVTICTIEEEDVIGELGSGGTGDGQFFWPSSIAGDKDQNVYLADEHLQRISIFTRDGDFIGKWGTLGDGDGQFNCPSSIAFDSEDNLFLVDSLNNRIQKFSKDGQFLAKWGHFGSEAGELNMPWGITIDHKDNVYVADWRNDRIQKFMPDGQFLMQFGSSGNGNGKFNRPTGVAVDRDGDIYVTDWGNNLLQIFSPDGTFINQTTGDGTLSKWGKEKLDANPEMYLERDVAHRLEREKLFWAPIDVVVDEENRIFVVDCCRNRIQIYQKES